MPRWGKVGKQKIVDEGPLPPYPDMTNVPNMHPTSERSQVRHDDVRRGAASRRSTTSWTRPRRTASRSSSGTTRRACTSGRSSRQKYKAMMNSETNYGLEEAGMAQLDDIVGAHHEAPRRHRRSRQHHPRLHHRQRRRDVHLAGRRQHAVQGHRRGRSTKAASASRASSAGRARSSRARSRTASSPASTGSRRFVAAAGNPNITDQLLKGVKLGDRDVQEPPRRLQPDGPAARARGRRSGTSSSTSQGRKLGAVRLDDMKFQFFQQPHGWPGPKVATDMPTLVNLRQDPFERFPMIGGEIRVDRRVRLRERLLRPRVLAVRAWSSRRWRSWP